MQALPTLPPQQLYQRDPQSMVRDYRPAPERNTTALTPEQMDRILETGKKFEAMFMGEMLKPLWSGMEEDPLFGGGSAEETYRAMLIEEYGKEISAGGGLGIADAVTREIIRMQSGNPEIMPALQDKKDQDVNAGQALRAYQKQ